MKIDNTRSTSGIRPTTALSRGATSGGAEAASSIAPARHINDSISIMGIPPEEMTPKVQQAITTLMEEVDHLRQQLNATHNRLQELERLANEDPLTASYNRRAFVREMSRMMSFAERYGVKSSLIFFDVNGLKEINDRYGHAAGDSALLHIAETLRHNVRESDIVGRLGGDEFGVILAQADQDIAAEQGERLAQTIRKTRFQWEGTPIALDAAYGVSAIDTGGDAGHALAEADKAMYVRKRGMKASG